MDNSPDMLGLLQRKAQEMNLHPGSTSRKWKRSTRRDGID
jgi:hypothetical protein